jgi:hypothetical protein
MHCMLLRGRNNARSTTTLRNVPGSLVEREAADQAFMFAHPSTMLARSAVKARRDPRREPTLVTLGNEPSLAG